jgi:L-lysine 2,3-aminomutase
MKKSSWKRDFKEASNGIELIEKHMKVAIPLYPQKGSQFYTKIPASFISRINPEDPLDPLLLQVMDPLKIKAGQGTKDPLNEQTFSHQGFIQKYKSRALIVTTQACPIHCRYCFRQHFPYDKNIASKDNYREIVKLIASDLNLKEVILSGGDPLSLSDDKLGQLINSIDKISHIVSPLQFLRE